MAGQGHPVDALAGIQASLEQELDGPDARPVFRCEGAPPHMVGAARAFSIDEHVSSARLLRIS